MNFDNDFGHWLAGIIDGEGWFSLREYTRKRPYKGGLLTYSEWRAYFGIALRSDDKSVIKMIHRYFDCGYFFERITGKKDGYNRHPQCFFLVANKQGLLKVIEIFTRFPLRTKKHKQFLIWVEGVKILCDRNRRFDHKYYLEEDKVKLRKLISQLDKAHSYNEGE